MLFLKSLPLLFTLLANPQTSSPVTTIQQTNKTPTAHNPLPTAIASPPQFPHLDKVIAYIENNSSCRWQRKTERNPNESFYCSAPLGKVQFRDELYRNVTISYFVTKEKKSGMALSLFKLDGDAGITARIIYDGGDAELFDGIPDKTIYKQVFLNDITRTLLEGSSPVDLSFTHPVEEYELTLYQAIVGGIAGKQ